MSSPEIKADKSPLELELEPFELPRRTILFFKALLFIKRARERKNRVQSLIEAKGYEKKAARHTETEPIQLSNLLMDAAHSYLRAKRPVQAVTNLEKAQPLVESYKMRGTYSGFFSLARLYHAMEGAYTEVGRDDEAQDVHEKSVTLAQDMEQHFDIHTEFLPDGSQLMSFVSPAK